MEQANDPTLNNTDPDVAAGRINFEAYNKEAGGLTHDGKPIPLWENLTRKVRANWVAGAVAVRRYVRPTGAPSPAICGKRPIYQSTFCQLEPGHLGDCDTTKHPRE